MFVSRIEPVSFNIGYTQISDISVKSCYVKYNRVIIGSKLDLVSQLLDSMREIIIEVEQKRTKTGIHNVVYSFLLTRTSVHSRVTKGFGVREHGLYQLYNCLSMWKLFLSSNLSGVYLHDDSAIQLERLCECNIRRIRYTIKEYDSCIQMLFEQQKKTHKHRILRWIQKYTVGKGYVPVFVPIDIAILPIIKHKWDFS